MSITGTVPGVVHCDSLLHADAHLLHACRHCRVAAVMVPLFLRTKAAQEASRLQVYSLVLSGNCTAAAMNQVLLND